jgi:hypothetical protein
VLRLKLYRRKNKKTKTEENEAKEERDRFLNSQRAVCKPKKFLKTIPYPDGYDLGNPYE